MGRWCRSHTWLETGPGQLCRCWRRGSTGEENAFCNHGGDDDGDGGDDGDGNGGDDDDGDGYGGDVGDGGDDNDGDAILVSGVVAKMRLRRHIALFDCVNMNCTAFSLCEFEM